MKNKLSILKLIMVYRNDNMVLEYIHMTLDSMSKYIYIVNQQCNYINVYQNRIAADEFRSVIMDLDKQRRTCHNSVINGIKKINSLCRKNNIPEFYDGNENDRIAIGDFCMNIVANTFKNRKK